MIVEEMPTLIGGLPDIQKSISYPEIAKKAGVSGTVFVQFVVDVDGSVVVEKDAEGKIINPQVVRGIGAGCDEEAVRAVRQAKFTPGKQRGKPVKVKMSLPIRFVLK